MLVIGNLFFWISLFIVLRSGGSCLVGGIDVIVIILFLILVLFCILNDFCFVWYVFWILFKGVMILFFVG